MTTAISSIRRFALVHDTLPSFHAAYLLLTLLGASLLNFGCFAIVMAAHMALDVVKYREVHNKNWRKTAEGVFRESLVDISLFFLGLTFAVYLHHSLPLIASLGGLLRAEVMILSAATMLFTKFHILYDFLKILSHVEHYLHSVHPRMSKKLTKLEVTAIVTAVASIALIVIAPLILPMEQSTYLHILGDQLIPWRI